jgi:hypothetical protein
MQQLKNDLIKVIDKYSAYRSADITKPSKNFIGGYFAPSFGFLRLAENVTCWDYSIPREMILGVEIGSNFSSSDRSVRQALVSEVKDILTNYSKSNKGFIVHKIGSAYSQLGWVIR